MPMATRRKRAATGRTGLKRTWRSAGIITLTTDFGTKDGYVGALKGVLTTLAPRARIIDITHDIDRGDVFGGALALEAATPTFPAGTVHVGVVDPGVGSLRRGIAIATSAAVFVGPDNGLFSLVARHPTSIVALDRTRWHRTPVSPTFHGRDVFAPVAARLAAGAAVTTMGSRVVGLHPLRIPPVESSSAGVAGQVIHVDRFGNLTTNIHSDDLAKIVRSVGREGLEARIRRRTIRPFVRTYADVEPGDLAVLIGSGGRLEIAVRDGSAAIRLGVAEPGVAVRVRRCLRANRR